MALFDKIYKAKYSAKNYKKYCKDANSTFVYTSVYLSYNENLDDLPKFVQNVHYITLFLADTLNSSLFLFSVQNFIVCFLIKLSQYKLTYLQIYYIIRSYRY